MGCGKSKPANVAAGNTIVTKKKNVESSSSSSSSDSSVSDQFANQTTVQNGIVEAANELEVVADAPVETEDKVEAEAMVNGEVKVAASDPQQGSENVEAVPAQPEIVASEESKTTVAENVQPQVTQPAPAESIETSLPQVTEAAAAESNVTAEITQTEATEAAAADSK